MPRIIACGSRQDAYKAFRIALNQGQAAMLLVDSEEAINNHPTPFQPWRHLSNRREDKMLKPDNACDEDCHLMVECMEAWFLADLALINPGKVQDASPWAKRLVDTLKTRKSAPD